jgi:hypothetical protein
MAGKFASTVIHSPALVNRRRQASVELQNMDKVLASLPASAAGEMHSSATTSSRDNVTNPLPTLAYALTDCGSGSKSHQKSLHC